MKIMAKNAEETRERIIQAATAEFAAHGIAGARVDRIARASGSNKGLIYIYYGSKESLFLAVLKRQIQRVYAEVPFTPDDLPGYAGNLFDFTVAHPDLMRLLTWHSLEGMSDEFSERGEAYDAKLRGIVAAQRDDAISGRFTPEFLMSVITAVSTAWTAVNPFSRVIDPDYPRRLPEYREAVVRFVSALFAEKVEKASPLRAPQTEPQDD